MLSEAELLCVVLHRRNLIDGRVSALSCLSQRRRDDVDRQRGGGLHGFAVGPQNGVYFDHVHGGQQTCTATRSQVRCQQLTVWGPDKVRCLWKQHEAVYIGCCNHICSLLYLCCGFPLWCRFPPCRSDLRSLAFLWLEPETGRMHRCQSSSGWVAVFCSGRWESVNLMLTSTQTRAIVWFYQINRTKIEF